MNKSQLINETRRRAPPNLILPRRCATSLLDSSFSQCSTTPTTKIAPSVLKIRSTIDNPKLSEIREKLFNGGDIFEIDDADLKPLQIHLREYAEKCAIQKRYDLVDKCNDFIEIVRNEARERSPPPDKTASKFKTCEEELEDLKRNQAERTADFEDEAHRKETELLEQHKQQLEAFENRWDNEMPQKYRKASSALLQLKSIERSALITGDFERARILGKEIEQRTNEERLANQKQYVSDYNTSKNQLLAKQKQQHTALRDRLDEERGFLQLRHNSELEVISKREGCVAIQKADFLKAREHVQISKGNTFMGRSRQTMVRSDEFDPLLPEIENISAMSKNDDKRSACSQVVAVRRFGKWNSLGTEDPKFRTSRDEKPKRTRRVIRTTKKPDIIRQREMNQNASKCSNASVTTEVDVSLNDEASLSQINDGFNEVVHTMNDAIFDGKEIEDLNLSDQLKSLVPGILPEMSVDTEERHTCEEEAVTEHKEVGKDAPEDQDERQSANSSPEQNNNELKEEKSDVSHEEKNQESQNNPIEDESEHIPAHEGEKESAELESNDTKEKENQSEESERSSRKEQESDGEKAPDEEEQTQAEENASPTEGETESDHQSDNSELDEPQDEVTEEKEETKRDESVTEDDQSGSTNDSPKLDMPSLELGTVAGEDLQL